MFLVSMAFLDGEKSLLLNADVIQVNKDVALSVVILCL